MSIEFVNDPRWTLNDKVVQLQGILDLHERSKKWIKLKEDKLRVERSKEITDLNKTTKQHRETIKQCKGGLSKNLLLLLHSDREVERICSKLQPEEIIETLDHMIFCNRKEYDKLKFELDRKEQELFDMMVQIEDMKNKQEDKTFSTVVMECDDLARQIQRVMLQQDAAQMVQSSYDKIKRILVKDARSFDALLSVLKADMVMLCQCVIKSLELGQLATEDKCRFEQEYRVLAEKTKRQSESRVAKINDMVKNVAKVKHTNSLVIRSDSFAQLPETPPEVLEYTQCVDETVTKMEDNLEALMEMTLASSHDEVFKRCEQVMKEKFYLLRQLDVNSIWRDTELMRKEHMGHLLESLEHSITPGAAEHEAETRRVEGEIQNQQKLYKKYSRRLKHDGAYILKIRSFILHFDRLLSKISLENPAEEFYSLGVDEDELSLYKQRGQEVVSRPTVEIPTEFSEGKERTDVEEKEEELEIMDMDLDTSHLIDKIHLKILLMMKQVSIEVPTEEGMRKAEELYQSKIMAQVESKFEITKPSIVKEVPKTSRKVKLPTREELKAISQHIVEMNEARPPPPNPYAKLVKHDCY